MARGDLVGTLDADDFCLARDAVQRQVAMLESDPSIGFVYTAYSLCDSDGRHMREYRPFAADRVRAGLDEFADLVMANHVSHSGTIVRRHCYDAVGGSNPALPYAGDLDLWLRLAGRYRVGYIADPLYAYRQHAQSMTSRGISPGAAIDEMLAAVNRGFIELPPDSPAAIRALKARAIQRVLLSVTWRERSLGHTRRSWYGLGAALQRAPWLLGKPLFYGALVRLLLLTAMGHGRYEQVSRWRARNPLMHAIEAVRSAG